MITSVGQQLGNYKIAQHIGQGGFADVYLGTHVHLNSQAAIKVLKTQLTQANEQSFIVEARIMVQLIHSHIVRVLEFGIEPNTGGTAYLIMDYATGGSLRQAHTKGTRLSPATIIPYLTQVADALQYVHDQRLIHRDVKPENMLIGRNGELLLSDFGIAVAAQQQGVAAIGTAAYMAPEQNANQPCPASDQYALGIVVYEWLCGSRPFTGQSNMEIALKHAKEQPPSLRSIDPSIPAAIEVVVLQALEKDPAQRYPSVKDFAHAFEQAWLASRSVSAPPTVKIALPHVSPPTLPMVQPLVSPPTLPMAPAQQPGGSLAPTVPLPTAPQSARVATTIRLTPPQRSVGDILYVHHGHTGFFAQAVAWSPNSTRVVSGADDQTVQVWDAFTGDNVRTFREHHDQVWTVAWSRKGDIIVSGSVDQTAHVWEAASGTIQASYLNHVGHAVDIGLAFAVAWSPDDQYIASGSADTTVQIWDAQTGAHHCTFQGHSAEINAIAWSPDGKFIASASDDKTVRVWNIDTGQTIIVYGGHTKRVRAVAWSPDGRCIASASDDATVRVWDAATGGQNNLLLYGGHTRRTRAVAWSPDSLRIASASNDTTIRIWNATTGAHIYTYRGHTADINALAWSPDGHYIASASDDETVQVWQAQ